jgi:hypothetical protein
LDHAGARNGEAATDIYRKSMVAKAFLNRRYLGKSNRSGTQIVKSKRIIIYYITMV